MPWVNPLKRNTVVDFRDIVGVAGFVSLLYGLASWWMPAAWMVGGILGLAVAFAPDLLRRS